MLKFGNRTRGSRSKSRADQKSKQITLLYHGAVKLEARKMKKSVFKYL